MRSVPGWLREARGLLRIGAGLARGAAGRMRRRLDPELPASWEFRGLSQSGEDGIVDHLVSRLAAPGCFAVEIGGGYGIDGNLAWLALVRRYRGLLVEADPERLAISRLLLRHVAPRLDYRCLRVSSANAAELAASLPSPSPDLLSLDIDGVDLHVARALLAAGLRPKVWVVEYNSAFGPDAALTVPDRPDLDHRAAHPSGLYYGASIGGWRRLFERRGYRFVTVGSSGVNAVFADPAAFPAGALDRLRGLGFAENRFQLGGGGGWPDQRAAIASLPVAAVD